MNTREHINPNLIKVFSALSNPVRLLILEEILNESCECDPSKGELTGNCVTKISEKLKIPQPSVSNHVKELINAGLVVKEKKGKTVFLFGNEQLASELTTFAELYTNKTV